MLSLPTQQQQLRVRFLSPLHPTVVTAGWCAKRAVEYAAPAEMQSKRRTSVRAYTKMLPRCSHSVRLQWRPRLKRRSQGVWSMFNGPSFRENRLSN